MRSFILLMAFVASLWAIDTGSLSFYLMKDGKPMKDQQVVIFKKSSSAVIEMPSSYNRHAEFVTDEDGYLNTVLPVGTYQLQVLAKDGDIAQAFVKKPFVIQQNKESQIIVSLNENDKVTFEDREAPKAEAVTSTDQNLSAKEKGFIKLSLVSSEDGSKVQNARIFVQGHSVDMKTDKAGQATLTLLEGEHTISIIHSNYSAQTIKLVVLPNEVVVRKLEMTPASMSLEEFVVLAPSVEGSVASVVEEEKMSEGIANIVGSEQMARQGDSNAASALKRVAGVTLIGGKDIYIRGLGDRYSVTELNSMPMPSPNPIKRTIPLDMFPSSIIGSLQVQKTFSPDITGAFGGGYVNIRTKKSTDEDYVKLKMGLNAHDSMGNTAISHAGSDMDWTGYDYSYRPFSTNFSGSVTPVVGEEAPNLGAYTGPEIRTMLQGRSVNRYAENVPYGAEFGMEVGKSFVFSDDHELNILATYDYKAEAALRQYTSHDYIISSTGEIQDLDNTAVNDLYKTTYQHGGVLNANYRLRNFDLGYTLLYVLNTLDQTRSIEGTFGENNSQELQSYFEWQQRQLFVNQFNGGFDYELFSDNRFNFGAEFAMANEYVPNDVSYNYLRDSETSPYQFKRNESKLTYDNRETDDELVSLYLNNRTQIPLFSEEDYLEVGALTEKKEREFRRVTLLVDSNIANTNSITYAPINDIINYTDGSELDYDLASQPKDSYDAEFNRDALYFKSLLKPVDPLEITFGLRRVDVAQHVDQFTTEAGSIVGTERNSLEFKKTLPSIAAKYAFNDNNQLRLAYSETFVYPDFREFVASEFIHPVYLAKVTGNPDLVETDIKNIDARYEYYFNATDLVSFALFYKDMKNPIEDTRLDTTGTIPRFSFHNADSAELAGYELSWYKHLDFISDSLDNLIFSGNYTHIESAIELTPEQKATLVTQERELQGLSPNVINLAMTYEDEDNRVVTLSYNKMDERLMRVAIKNGTVILGLDDYEIPPDLVDLTWIEKFKVDSLDTNMALTFKAKNLLDDETVWTQGGKTTLVYKTGRSYSLSLSAKF